MISKKLSILKNRKDNTKNRNDIIFECKEESFIRKTHCN